MVGKKGSLHWQLGGVGCLLWVRFWGVVAGRDGWREAKGDDGKASKAIPTLQMLGSNQRKN